MVFALISVMIVAQAVAPSQTISKVESLHLGKHFDPWLTRIRNGDPWALAELIFECSRLNDNVNVNLEEMSLLAIPQVRSSITSDPGRAYYYLAELTKLAYFPINGKEKESEYLDLLEMASKNGYGFADFKLYRDVSLGGHKLYLARSPHRKSKEEIQKMVDEDNARKEKERATGIKTKSPVQHLSQDDAWLRERADFFKRRAVQELIPLAHEGNMAACTALLTLLGDPLPSETQTRFTELCNQAQVQSWIEEAAKDGNYEAQTFVAWSHIAPKNLTDFAENSVEFQEIIKIGNRYDPLTIQQLVDYFCEKREWSNAQRWATKGREALGQTNQWLDRAFGGGVEDGDGD